MSQVLFDKNVPYRMRRYLVNHTVRTAAEMGWGRLTNGELLSAAESEGFQVMVTADQGIQYQQNLTQRKIALVVLSTNDREVLETQAHRLVSAMEAAKSGGFEFIKYNLPPKLKWKPRGPAS